MGLVEGQPLHCAGAVSGAPPLGNLQRRGCLTQARTNSYLQLIPINRFPAAHSCARRFFVWSGAHLATEMGR